MLRLNSLRILDKAIECALSDPMKYNTTLNKLLDKISPNLNVNTNIDVSIDFENKLIDVLGRANNLKAVEVANIELIPEQTTDQSISHLLDKEENKSIKTDIYIDSVQEINTNTKKELNNEQSDKPEKAGEN